MKREPSLPDELPSSRGGLLSQPRAVWAVAFACIISFMGLGLVDPILPAIADQLHASKSQVSLLFTSYNAVTGVAMLITGVVSSRIGVKWTLLSGIFLGINNTLITTAVMEAAPVERSVASAAYSFVRFLGGALAPWLAGKLSEWFLPETPFYFGALMVLIGVVVLLVRRRHLRDIDAAITHH